MRMATGAGAFRSMPRAPSVPPSASTKASLTILMTCCAGETERITSCPTARSFTRATRSRTTGKATSASSNATRTSRSASVTSASLSAPRRRSRSKTPLSLLDRASNMAAPNSPFALRSPQNRTRRCASLRGAAEPTRIRRADQGSGRTSDGGRLSPRRLRVKRKGVAGASAIKHLDAKRRFC